MDHELKQRLIGAVVVTALAAIFIPMLFDDPVDKRANAVTELSVPPLPAEQDKPSNSAGRTPVSKEQVLNQAEPGLSVSEMDEDENAKQAANLQEGNTPSASNATSTKDSQGLQAKIAGLPANNEKDAAMQETVPPAEDEEPAGEAGLAEPVAPPDSKKALVKPENAAKKPESAKPEKIKADEASKTTADKAKKANSKLARWSLQAGSFSKKENAQAMVDKLRKQGFPASMVSKGNLYRIKIGPELDKTKAAAMKAKLASQNIQSYLQAE